MRPHLVRPARALPGAAALLAVLLAVPAADAGAQPRAAPGARTPIAEVTPYAGYMTFGSYVDGPLGTDVRGAAAPVGGAQLTVRVTPGIALVANGAYSSGDLEVGVPILGGFDVGSRKSWLYDAGVELRLPTTSGATPISPFLQLGAGAITTRLGSAGVTTTATNAAANAGVGLDLSLGGVLGVRAMVKDYVSRYQSEEVAGLRVKGDVNHNLAASVGVRLSF